MIDSRLALLTKTADVPGAAQEGERSRLDSLLRKAQIDDIPKAREHATRTADINQQNSDVAADELLIKYQKFLGEQDKAAQEEGIRTANQFLQIKSQGDLDIWRANNPVDSEGAPLAFESSEFQDAYRHSEMILQASLAPQAPDRTLVEVGDETSPTGTRFVPRAEAVGQPGKPGSQTSLTTNPDGGVTFTQGRGGNVTPAGNIPLNKSPASKVQDDIISLEDSLARTTQIGAEYEREYLTYAGKYGAQLSAIKDKANMDLSEEDKAFLKGRTRFTMQINREFNLYRKMITGAAAAEKELEDLKKATINEDLSPAQFEAAFEIYQEELSRGLRLKRKLVRDGIAVGSSEFGDRFDNEYLSGADDSSEARMEELMNRGLNEEASLDRLIDEGYE